MNRILAACLVFTVALVNSAAANVHAWLFDEIYSNPNSSVQFIELQTAVNGQEFFKTGGNNSRLNSLAPDFSVHDTYFFPNDLNTGGTGTGNHTALIGTAALAAAAGVIPDFIIPDGFLLPGGGMIEFESDVFSTFATVTYPAFSGGSQSYDAFTMIFGPNTPKNFAGVVGHVPPPPFPGDANGDRTVDFTDLGILLNNYEQLGSFATGDFDASGTVDFTDLGILLNNYNQTAPASSPEVAIPEPSTLALAAFGALGLLIAAHRKR